MSHIQSLTVLRALSGRFPSDTTISDRVKAVLNRIEKEASGLLEYMEHPNPDLSSEAVTRVVNAEKSKLRDLIAASRNEVNPMIAKWQNEQTAARVKKAALVPDEYAAEIRQTFRLMPYPAQLAFVADATSRLDGPTIAAIITAPPVLSGLTPEQVERFREAFLDRTSKSSAPLAEEMQSCTDTFFNSADGLAKPDGAARLPGGMPAGSQGGVIVMPQAQ